MDLIEHDNQVLGLRVELDLSFEQLIAMLLWSIERRLLLLSLAHLLPAGRMVVDNEILLVTT